eukprot:4996208-Karenia_brevis.AAC.1
MCLKGGFVYKGVGCVQYRHPSSLLRAWNYEHCCDSWKVNAAQHGVDQGQLGFLMTEETRNGPR